MRYLLIALSILCYSISISAQDTRSYDGFNNNLSNPELGAAGSMLKNYVAPSFDDGMQAPNGTDRPNPRHISNALFAQSNRINDTRNLSDMVWVFGQFMDHDITLVHNSATEPAMIAVPQGDPLFDPFNTGAMVIPMMRSEHTSGTGTDVNNPRRYTNDITSFIDASAVYGSTETTANWLRTFEDGKMYVSEDNLLPLNTLDKTFNSAIDPDAPHMENGGSAEKLYIAGDVRANENILLSAIHTIFHREHNRLCDALKIQNPSWSDEALFQHARRLVAGLIQSVTYNEWLPAMGVHLPEYVGYDDAIDPSMSNLFSAAAFRLGHTLLNSNLMRLDREGVEIGQGNIDLKDAFFNPSELLIGGGVEPLFQGMAFQVQQNLDCKVVDDIRNFLFGAPGAGGLDLAAININRSRERGVPSYSVIRDAFGIGAVNDFTDITSDVEMSDALQSVYSTVDQIDPWVGLLAEDHMDDAMIGPTLMAIMTRQFQDVRDGDRFYFMVDPGLSDEERTAIQQTRMSDIIMRNSDLQVIQENVFIAEDPQVLVSIREEHLEIIPYPNPFVDGVDIALYSTQEGAIELQVFDQIGRLVKIQNDQVTFGTNVFRMEFDAQIAAGLYTVQAKINGQSSSANLIKSF